MKKFIYLVEINREKKRPKFTKIQLCERKMINLKKKENFI